MSWIAARRRSNGIRTWVSWRRVGHRQHLLQPAFQTRRAVEEHAVVAAVPMRQPPTQYAALVANDGCRLGKMHEFVAKHPLDEPGVLVRVADELAHVLTRILRSGTGLGVA
jgi:hypothetical protein